MYNIGEVTFYGRKVLRTTLHFQGLQWKTISCMPRFEWQGPSSELCLDGTTQGTGTAQLHSTAHRKPPGLCSSHRRTRSGHLLIPCWGSTAGSSSLTAHMIILHRLPQQEKPEQWHDQTSRVLVRLLVRIGVWCLSLNFWSNLDCGNICSFSGSFSHPWGPSGPAESCPWLWWSSPHGKCAAELGKLWKGSPFPQGGS